MTWLGLQSEILAPGRARVWGTLRPEHLNGWGSAHGGFLYTLADAAFALASNSHGIMAVALSTHMEYLQASQAGDRLEALAEEVHLGRRTAVYRVEVRCGAELRATFTGQAYRRPEQPAWIPKAEDS